MSEKPRQPGAAGSEGGRRPGVGRREGPGRTHHSVGSAGWLALAGRSGRRSRADTKKRTERQARPAVQAPGPALYPRPGPPRPKEPVNKPTSSLPPAPLFLRPLRALGIAAGAALTGPRGRRAVPPQPQAPCSGPRGVPASESDDAGGFPPAARRRRHFSSQQRRRPCWP